jgi:hypothetical protein
MSGEYSNASTHDAIGADAVCAQCGTVNPEGVFICRTCGNNLRDQRALRLAAEQILLEGDEGAAGRQWHFTSFLAVVGILVVFLTALNVDRISDWLVDVQNPTINATALLWDAPEADSYDALLAQIRAARPSAEALAAARETAGSGLETGLYAVYYEEMPVGTAAVELRDDAVYFAAALTSGAEIRGIGALDPNSGITVAWDKAGVYWNYDYYAVAGAGLVRDNGAIECFGQGDWEGASYEFAVYRLAAE